MMSSYSQVSPRSKQTGVDCVWCVMHRKVTLYGLYSFEIPVVFVNCCYLIQVKFSVCYRFML